MKNRRQTKRSRLHRLFVFVALLLIAGGAFLIFKPTHAELAEINPEDWTLELLFFDSTVNKGRDPIVNEEWIIESSGRSDTFERTITMQVNYRNENIDRDYAPGELQIKVPNPFKTSVLNTAQLQAQIAIGANNDSQTAYDWNYNYSTYASSGEFIFTNNTAIEAYSNVEGSIQMVYAFTSKTESAEKYDDSCMHEIDHTNLKAIMNGVAESNEASFKYSRTYNHVWTKAQYNIKTLTSKIDSYDNLGENPADYTWVKYRFYGKSSNVSSLSYSGKDYTSSGSLIIGLSEFRVRNPFPDNVKMIDRFGNELSLDDEGYLQISENIEKSSYSVCSSSSYDTCYELYVGYPKDKYNDELGTSQITNIVELRGTYSSEDSESALADSTVEFNINDFAFTYNGGGFGVDKRYYGNSYVNQPYYYQDIIRQGSTGTFYNYVNTGYAGQSYTARISDDVLYYIDEQAAYHQLEDNQYYFATLTIPQLTNSSGTPIVKDKYPYSVYVRYRGETEFEKYDDYTETGKTITFGTERYVQAWRVDIPNMTEGIKNNNFSTQVTFKDTTIPRTGTLYNFSYIDVLINGTPAGLSDLDHYATGVTKEYIAPYDIEHYGHYVLRSVAQAPWEYHDIGDSRRAINVSLSNLMSPSFDPSDEYFKGSLTTYGQYSEYNSAAFSDVSLNIEQYEEKDWRKYAYMDVLMPLGMEPNASEEEIATSANNCSWSAMIGTDGQPLFANRNECINFMREHTTVEITKNWNNTGRWHIRITLDYSSKPFTLIKGPTNSNSYQIVISAQLPYKISYDAYAEYGRTYTTRSYLTPDFTLTSGTKDNGRFDAEEADINGNGSIEDYIAYSAQTINLVSATSTRQDIQISVLTDHNGNYDIEDSRSGAGEDYVYKLRMRTGSNRATNVVLYDHIEEAYENNDHWKGHFNGVDVSYAESKLDNYDKPIRIKVYWSPKTDAGSLADDNSWQEYDENTTDKTQVRSLAFEYLDPDGNPSILPQATYSYVLVKMKATEEEDVNSFTYNSLVSEWNAIDNFTGAVIHNITGLTSNVVRVYLQEDLTLHVRKIWDDYDNYYNKRPETLTFTLYYDGEEIDAKTINVAEGETEVVFENLDILNQELYTVEEEEVEGYISSAEQNGVTLAYEFTNKIDAPGPSLNPQTTDANPWLYVAGGGVVVAIVGVGAVSFARRRA